MKSLQVHLFQGEKKHFVHLSLMMYMNYFFLSLLPKKKPQGIIVKGESTHIGGVLNKDCSLKAIDYIPNLFFHYVFVFPEDKSFKLYA